MTYRTDFNRSAEKATTVATDGSGKKDGQDAWSGQFPGILRTVSNYLRCRVAVMSEREWEPYQLSLAERIPESTYKTAVTCGIKNKLKVLEMEASSVKNRQDLVSERHTTLRRGCVGCVSLQ